MFTIPNMYPGLSKCIRDLSISLLQQTKSAVWVPWLNSPELCLCVLRLCPRFVLTGPVKPRRALILRISAVSKHCAWCWRLSCLPMEFSLCIRQRQTLEEATIMAERCVINTKTIMNKHSRDPAMVCDYPDFLPVGSDI